MSGARRVMLARIRGALHGVPAGEADRWDGPGDAGSADAYRAGPLPGAAPPAAVFAERVADYRAEIVRSAAMPDVIGAAIASACARHGAKTMLVPADLPAAWMARGISWLADPPQAPLDVAELDAADGVVSGAALAIAETGTIALDHGAAQGRRALTLVPDLHICVVRAEQVVTTVPEGMRRLRASAVAGRPITLIAGPSATSDIELERVEGVHGPRRLVVVIAG